MKIIMLTSLFINFFNSIDIEVKKTWDDVRDLIINHKLHIERKLNKEGHYIINKSGTYMESPNFPKLSTHKVFIRGGASQTLDKYKTLEINGLKMLPQYVWLDKKYVQELIKNE